MTRTTGSPNIIAWDKRTSIPTTASAGIKHLASTTGATVLEEFRDLLGHQRSYLNWIDSRHEQLQAAKKTISPASKGPKDATYKKYRWYAEQQTLFETINAFEVFFKRTFVVLAQALRSYVPADSVKGSIDAKVLWSMRGKASVPALIFEHQLFHDLDQIDKTSQMLVEHRRYNVGSSAKAMRPKIKALQAAFQVRHTLAHNQGLVTASDRAKFGFHGYSAVLNEVMDPSKDQVGEAIRRFLFQEASDYTDWLLNSTATFLSKAHADTGVALKSRTHLRIEKSLGTTATLKALAWSC